MKYLKEKAQNIVFITSFSQSENRIVETLIVTKKTENVFTVFCISET